jgi:hypothetical protein
MCKFRNWALMAGLLVALAAQGQRDVPLLGAGSGGSASFPPIALGVHATADNGAATATTVAVNIGTPTAGSTIFCNLRLPFPSADGPDSPSRTT